MGGYRGARVAADLTSHFTKLESPTMKRCGEKRGPPSVMPPNKRLKLAGPAFKGGVRLGANELVPQGGALPPAGVRPAA